MTRKSTYDKAFNELQTIIDQLNDDQIGIDDLSKKVKRAQTLIVSCKSKLRNIEEDLSEIFDKMDE